AHCYLQGPTTDASLESAHIVTTDAGAEELAYVFAPIPGGAEHPLFRYDPTTGEAVYYLQDSMGSVIGLVDETTTQTATFEYDGFGGERASTGTLANLPIASRGDYRFHGMWLDSSVGLYYVRARVYDSEVGRFLSNDPAEGHRRRPETFEAQRFAGGNPGVGRDPTGRLTLVEIGVRNVVQAVIVNVASATFTNLHRWHCGAAINWSLFSTAALTGILEGLLNTGVFWLFATAATGESWIDGEAHYRLEGAWALAHSLIEGLVLGVLREVVQIVILEGRAPTRLEALQVVSNAVFGVLVALGTDVALDGSEEWFGELVETIANVIVRAFTSVLEQNVSCAALRGAP
ncbi:MAG: RHS repeat-associated core domain-containing protein, partial [Sandaracinaceae bacterium]|nr:RHS repeat-associated core domain-containing protein [Sandaracinaceae bacterium]